MNVRICALLAVLAALTAGAAAQTADETAVRDAVDRFLLHLGDHQFDAVAGDLAPKGAIVVVRQRPANGSAPAEWTTSYQTTEDWLAALKRNPNPTSFREPITNVKVTVDSDRLAYVRADFQVVRDGHALSSGVDQFTLVREPAGWKIAVVAYTSIPTSR
jgi:hypothetical protein